MYVHIECDVYLWCLCCVVCLSVCACEVCLSMWQGVSVCGRVSQYVAGCLITAWCALTSSAAGGKQEGAVGVIKGIGRGTAGLLLKPIGGVIDFTSSNLTSLKK